MGQNALEMVTATLKAMANGGIHDHVGQVCVCERERERENEGVCVCGVSTYVLCMYSNSILSSSQGFHRYSTDEYWHVPHFEKMLYDQAQLAWIYLDAYQVYSSQLCLGLRNICGYFALKVLSMQFILSLNSPKDIHIHVHVIKENFY